MTTVVGAGTGANYAVTAGVIHGLLEDGLEISEGITTSGSGLPMAFAANGGSMLDFLKLAKEHPPVTLIRPNWKFLLVPGLFHLQKLEEFMRPHVAKKFKDTQFPHTVLAYDSDGKEGLFLGTHTTPEMSVARAQHASMAIPWVMRHVDIDGVRATDGGSVHNFAIDVPNDPAVGIRVLGAKSNGPPKRWKWWASYSWNHIDGMLQASERAHIATGLWKKHKIITVESPISGMDFHKVDAEMIDKLFSAGYEAVKTKLVSGWSWRP